RTLRQKRGFYTTLSEIDGLGKKAINSLLLKFGSVAEIARATVEELEQTEGIGKKRATAIYQYFNSDKGEL
ncbi:MAG: excinuclease ABC subunit C, partial [Clostridia bacterium]|nr:excinuclease ABC subunit C [Clostridia bacterium]